MRDTRLCDLGSAPPCGLSDMSLMDDDSADGDAPSGCATIKSGAPVAGATATVA